MAEVHFTDQLTAAEMEIARAKIAAVKVFISYRREDSAGHTGRLYDSLRARFGDDNVFLDVSGIDSGRKFVDVIQNAIHTCDVLLAVIGPEWLTCLANGRRRIDDPDDLVRKEIGTAIAGGIPVIPVLVGGARPPAAATLPQPLQPLAALDAHDMTDERWAFDSERLIQSIERLAGRPSTRPAAWSRALLAAVLVSLAVLVIGFVAWQRPSASSPSIAGDWQANVTYDWGAKYTEQFSLMVDGGVVSGTASFLGVPRAIVTGTLANDQVTFETRTQEVVDSDSPPRTVTHRYRGRIAPESIAFTMTTQGGSSDVPAEFVAVPRP
jgi:hypothetical protein